ncbi:MAG: polysaccharide biosynthesis C-terminal domain-containing protein [Bacteroidetes bacterium]|nr:polysaccharide biosynthesis C-terminal domain-containing protein [Bacteroidota bacterium]
MSSPLLKKLAGQTAVYGLGTILGRVLNYLLTPLYTGIFAAEAFGTYSEAYSYIAILLIVLTYGMETALFHFAQKNDKPKRVFSTAAASLLLTTACFWIFLFPNSSFVSELMNYPGHPEYVVWLGLIIGFDALSSLPMAWLRLQGRPGLFSIITLVNIGVNIGLNLFWLKWGRDIYLSGNASPFEGWGLLEFNPEIGVGYIFLANLIASGVKLLLCIPFLKTGRLHLDARLLRQMLTYSAPLLVAGLGFILNERLDVLMLKYILPLSPKDAMHQVGVYGACYKLAILMTIFIQAFRYAAEPFFFSQQNRNDAKEMYASVMNYFVAFCSVLFLMVVLHLDIFKHFLRDSSYWEGLSIVPVIMLANIFLGIYMNLSMWYKLSGQTKYGAIFSVIGAAITIGLNAALIPYFGFVGSAYTTLAAYGTMMVLSYLWGLKEYPIPYNLKRIAVYLGLSVLLYLVHRLFDSTTPALRLGFGFIMWTAFVAFALLTEFPNLKKQFSAKWKT